MDGYQETRGWEVQVNRLRKDVKFTRQIPVQNPCRYRMQHKQKHGDAESVSVWRTTVIWRGVRVGMPLENGRPPAGKEKGSWREYHKRP